MHGIDGFDRKALEQAIVDHRLRAGEALFAGLEDQHRGAIEAPRLGQVARRTDQHGRVAVVPAAVHQALRRRAPGEVVLLGHLQRVHVGAQADLAPARAVATVHEADHAGLADALVDLVDAGDAQRLDHAGGGAALLVAEFGMRVQVASERGQLAVPAGQPLVGAVGRGVDCLQHQWPPVLPSMRRRGSTPK